MRQGKKETFDGVFGALCICSAKKRKYIEAKNRLFNNVKKFTRGEKKLLKSLKIEYFRQIMMMKKKMNKLDTKKKKLMSEMKMLSLIVKGFRD